MFEQCYRFGNLHSKLGSLSQKHFEGGKVRLEFAVVGLRLLLISTTLTLSIHGCSAECIGLEGMPSSGFERNDANLGPAAFPLLGFWRAAAVRSREGKQTCGGVRRVVTHVRARR